LSNARADSRRARFWRRLAILFSLGVAFVLGIGVGEAIHDQPDLGGTQTLIRTLRPLPITPIPAETVTVTTTAP
jgi:hypothetical protein